MKTVNLETALTVAQQYREWDAIVCHAYETVGKAEGRWAVVLRWHPNQPGVVVLMGVEGNRIIDVHTHFGDADFWSDEEAIALALRIRDGE